MIREFRQETRTKKVNRWRIWRDGDQVSFQDGLVGGKLKIATTHGFDEPLNKGKANEKSTEQQAIEFMERQILLKERKGYREVNPKSGEYLQYVPEKKDSLTTFAELPQELRFFKPQNSMNAYIEKMIEQRKAWWLRKRDGCMHVYVIDEDGRHRMYSSTTTPYQKDEPGVDIILRYPQVEMAMKSIPFLQPKSVFLGEICCVAAGGYKDEYGFDVDSRDIVNGVRGAKLDYALQLQNEKGQLGFCIWDIAFWGGTCQLHQQPACDRYLKIRTLIEAEKSGFITFPEVCRWDEANDIVIMDSPANLVQCVDPEDGFSFEVVDGDIRKTMLDAAKQLGWEGWVVVDPESTYDDRAYNFRGKAERPKTCVKDKPKREADFIVRWDPAKGIGKKGKGKKSSGVGSVQAYLMHPERGEIPVALIGGGLSDDQVNQFANPKLYPMVWQVEFEDWTKTGSITQPRLVHVRDDKTPDECGVEQNPDWEEHYFE